MSDSKKIVILAGPNGAGKTTFAREFLLHEADCPIFVNADLIASGLSPFRPEVTALRAGRLMIEEIRGHARGGRSFAFETTLSGLAYARLIPRWRRQGYRVKLIYLRLASVDLALSRVAARVMQGGHGVPDNVVVRRSPSAGATSSGSTSRWSMTGLCTTIQETPLSWWRRGEGHEAKALGIDRPVPRRSPARSQACGSRRSAALDRDRNPVLRARERPSRGSERDAVQAARRAGGQNRAKTASPRRLTSDRPAY